MDSPPSMRSPANRGQREPMYKIGCYDDVLQQVFKTHKRVFLAPTSSLGIIVGDIRFLIHLKGLNKNRARKVSIIVKFFFLD